MLYNMLLHFLRPCAILRQIHDNQNFYVMKRVWELLFFAVFGVLSVACGEQELERAFLKLETTNLEFEAVGAAVQTVAVTSNVDWDCTMKRRVEGLDFRRKENGRGCRCGGRQFGGGVP